MTAQAKPAQSMSLPRELLASHINPVLVETGTYKGGTVALGLALGFDEIHSIEFDVELARFCKERFKRHKEVHIYQGESFLWLEKVLPLITRPTTFWLDAHEYNKKYGAVRDPLIRELRVLNRYPEHVHTVLIDDRRLLGWGDWKEGDEHDVLTLLRLLGLTVSFTDSMWIKNDIIIGTRS